MFLLAIDAPEIEAKTPAQEMSIAIDSAKFTETNEITSSFVIREQAAYDEAAAFVESLVEAFHNDNLQEFSELLQGCSINLHAPVASESGEVSYPLAALVAELSANEEAGSFMNALAAYNEQALEEA
ncbi:MAG: hypothetical protein AAGI90_02760 [Chlamydiota bacterium]